MIYSVRLLMRTISYNGAPYRHRSHQLHAFSPDRSCGLEACSSE